MLMYYVVAQQSVPERDRDGNLITHKYGITSTRNACQWLLWACGSSND